MLGFSTAASVSLAGAGAKDILTITDGALSAQLSLFGQYVAAGFSLSADGDGGTLVTYNAPASPHLEIAAKH